jgi:hypothetical protein
MPRTANAPKRQQGAANHRDTRHENGLVGPGKRVHKQKSNGQLNGHAKASESIPLPPPLPATPPPSNGHTRQPSPADHTIDHKMAANGSRRPSVGDYSELSSAESFHNPPVVAVSNDDHRRIDVNAAKNPNVHRDPGLLARIITSCPLFDTIAILIVLLQLPPTFLTIIQLLFTTLTFVPPSSATGGITAQDILNGSMGTPSIPVIVVMDIIFWLSWLFLWDSAQDFALDLAQSVIALTLGGGASGKDSGKYNVLVCFGIIGASHLSRNTNVKQSGLRAIFSSTSSLMGSTDSDDPLEPLPKGNNWKGPHNALRTFFGIHIVTQGVVRYVRNWYVRRERRDTTSSIGDPEAAKVPAESTIDVPNSHTPDAESSTSLPASNALATKKKKKQNAQVRVKQPLWAALASTKIVVVKEYETSHAAVESAGTNATDVNNLGNAPFDSEAERIWVTDIDWGTTSFSTSFFPTYTPRENSGCTDASNPQAPFYVKVNGIVWQLTEINAMDSDQPIGQSTRWEGVLSGLAPMTSYTCEFIRSEDNSPLFTTMVRTRQTPLGSASFHVDDPLDQDRGASNLRVSILAAETKLTEDRNRLKNTRKDQRKELSTIRKDIDKFTSQIASSGGSDDRSRQRIQQSKSHLRQADDAVVALQEEIDSFASVPTENDSEYKISKVAYQSEKALHKQACDDFNNTRKLLEQDLQALQNEHSVLQQKQERLRGRTTKLEGEHERITDANAKGLDEAQRKASEQDRKTAERGHMDMILSTRLQALNLEIENLLPNIEATKAAIFNNTQQQYVPSPTTSLPAHGYGDVVDGVPVLQPNSPWNPNPNTAGLYAPAAYGAAMMTSTSNQGIYGHRGRSSSMLSNVSGFTQSSGEDMVQLPTSYSKFLSDEKQEYNDRKDSSGSGSVSGSTSGPGSVREPKSPIRNGKGRMPAAWFSDEK